LSVFQGFLTAQGAKKNVDIKMYSVVFFVTNLACGYLEIDFKFHPSPFDVKSGF
jgi:hypothetical protein